MFISWPLIAYKIYFELKCNFNSCENYNRSGGFTHDSDTLCALPVFTIIGLIVYLTIKLILRRASRVIQLLVFWITFNVLFCRTCCA